MALSVAQSYFKPMISTLPRRRCHFPSNSVFRVFFLVSRYLHVSILIEQLPKDVRTHASNPPLRPTCSRLPQPQARNYIIHDPSLTPNGEDQCRQLCQRFPYHQSVDLLVASPLRRTIYTALLSFQPEIERGVKFIALPEVQETSSLPCDTGTDAERLKQEMDGKPVDLSLVHDGWNSKSGRWASTGAAIEERARQARLWLKSRPEKEIVVVTHGGLLHYLTEDWTESGIFDGTGWANTEFRSYHFAEAEEDDGDASMTETAESNSRRRGTEKPLTKAERLQLRETAKKTWERQGFQVESEV